MAATVTIRLTDFRTDKQRKLLKILNDKQVRKNCNIMIRDAITPFIPMKSGKLRRSAAVFPDSIRWGNGIPYGRYQYYGRVYAPNYLVVRDGERVWRTPKGMKKYPTNRELGVPGEYMGMRFGYTTPGTQHHWDKAFTGELKRKTNMKITNYLKSELAKH